MSFLTNFFSKPKGADRFLGNWVIDKSDLNSIKELGDVKLAFKKDGSLVYEIRESDKNQFILMTYLIEGDKLITDQPSHPHKEETDFDFESPSILLLKFNGVVTRFIKS